MGSDPVRWKALVESPADARAAVTVARRRPQLVPAAPAAMPAVERVMGEVRGWQARQAWRAAHPEEAAREAAEIAARQAAWRAQEAEREANERREAREAGMARRAAWLVRCGFDAVTAAAAVAPFQTVALEELAGWAGSGATFALLTGAVGSGKGVASAVEALRIGERHLWSRRTVLRVDTRALRPWWGEDGDAFQAMAGADLLVLDELGAVAMDKAGQWLSGLERLVDVRYGGRRRTLLIGNLQPSSIHGLYGERIWSRLAGTYGVDAGPVDYRRQG